MSGIVVVGNIRGALLQSKLLSREFLNVNLKNEEK